MRQMLLLLFALAVMQATAQVKVGQKPSALAVPHDSLTTSLAAKNRLAGMNDKCPAGQTAQSDTATQSIMLKRQLNSMPVSDNLKMRPVDYKYLPSTSFTPNMPEDQGQLRLRRRNNAEDGYGSSLVEAGVSILQGILK